MAEYIERDAVVAGIEKRIKNPVIIRWLCGIIGEQPAADVAPVVHGRWIKRPDERICPFCNDSHAYFGGADWNYCPNCGARMDGE